MKYVLTLLIFFTSNSFAETECNHEVPSSVINNNEVIQAVSVDCTEKSDKESSCECLNNLKFPILKSEELSSFSEKRFYSKHINQIEKSVFLVANQLNSYSALPSFKLSKLPKECSFEQLTKAKCSTKNPLFNNHDEVETLRVKLKNNLLNFYKPDNYLEPDFIKDRGCNIPDSAINLINSDVNTMMFDMTKEIIKRTASQHQIQNSMNLNELIMSLYDSENLDDDSYDQLEIFHDTFKANPIFKTILNDKKNYNQIMNKNNTLELISSSKFENQLERNLSSQCQSLKKKIKRVQCIDKSEITIPFSQFKNIIKEQNDFKTNPIATNNSDLDIICNKKQNNSETIQTFSELDSELPTGYQLKKGKTLGSIIENEYSNKILHHKVKNNRSKNISLCDYIPQPSIGKKYNSVGIKNVINDCEKDPDPTRKYTYSCLQAEIVKKTYGPRLEEISELEEKITLVEKEDKKTRTIEFNGEVISITDAKAKRELLVKNLFIEDQQPPKLIQDFIGEDAPKLATSKKPDSKSKKQTSNSEKESSSSSVSSSSTSSSRGTTSNNLQSSSSSFQPQPVSPFRSGPITQAQRDQNTRDFFNDISERFRSDRAASEQAQKSKNAGRSIASASSRLSDFDSDFLDQAANHLPATSSNIGSDFDNGSDSSSFSNQFDGPTFDEQRSFNTGDESRDSAEESYNKALGASYEAAEKRRATAAGQVGSSRRAGSGGRSPASTSSGGSSGGVPGSSGVNVSTGGTNEYGETTKPIIELDPELTGSDFRDIVELVQNDPTAKNELIELIESKEVRTFVIKQGEFEVLVTKKQNGYFSVRSEGNEADLSYRDFLTKIKTTFLNIKNKKLTKKDEIIKELSGIEHTDAFSDLSNL